MTPEMHAGFGEKKLGSVGKPFGGAQLRVVHPETGAEQPPGQEGLIEVISPKMGPDWIHTSDLGVIDEDGFIFLRGRADGAIMRGGFKLLPETIEQALLGHAAISAAAVVGIPDRRLGQVPAAAIQLKPGVSPPAVAELEAHLRELVLATHIPVRWKFLGELPKTVSMKVDRPALVQLFADATDA
jgi:acyl-coenzyme A synthetase/AMP-(fatty) acid ligase